MNTNVLIVGAGPTGLTLACQLAARGVKFRIIDAAPGPQTGSRGKGLQPRSLELFDDLGIISEILADGAFNIPIRHYDEEGKYNADARPAAPAAKPDVPYASPLLIPQFRVEEKLRRQLAALGGDVAFGTHLSSFRQDSNGVVATLDGPEGQTVFHCRYLVGCDGGKSIVRKLSGISFAGETIEQYRMLLGDVRVEGLDRDHWHIWRSKAGFFALCPLPSTNLFQLQASIGPEQDDEVSVAAMQRHADERVSGVKVAIVEAEWMSIWRANIRMVDRYRDGNVFLAGDAAHVHSPAGGQGMNTGIQDGYNLGWKLDAVLSGASPTLLDTYQEERLPIAAWVLGLSTELMDAAAKAGQIQFRRDEKTMQLGLNYRHSRLSVDKRLGQEGLRAGDRAPDAPGLVGPNGECRMFDLMRGPHWTLIGIGSCWGDIIADCVALKPDQIRGVTIGSKLGDAEYFDRDGNAGTAYGKNGLFVIRPDNYVGMASESLNPVAIKAYLRGYLP